MTVLADEVNTCLHCGKPAYWGDAYGGAVPKKFCSQKCRGRFRYGIAEVSARCRMSFCVVCGALIVGRKKACCSKECTVRSLAKACEYCGGPCKDKRRQYCGWTCANRAKTVDNFVFVSGTCPHCKEEFVRSVVAGSLNANSAVRFCSDSCRHNHHGSFKRHRRRTLEECDDSIHLGAVWDRDGGKCHLCGRAVPRPGEAKTVRKRASIDHIVPLSKGGSHTWDNVALAHVSCNSSKNDSNGFQRRLF